MGALSDSNDTGTGGGITIYFVIVKYSYYPWSGRVLIKNGLELVGNGYCKLWGNHQ